MTKVKIGSLVFEYDPTTRYLGIGNGEELLGTAEVDQETWDEFELAAGRKPIEIPAYELERPPEYVDIVKRAGEAREKLSLALGIFRLSMGSPVDETVRERDKGIELGMVIALDRLDCVLQDKR